MSDLFENAKERNPKLADSEVEILRSDAALAERAAGEIPTAYFLADQEAGEETRWASLWFSFDSGAVMEFFSFGSSTDELKFDLISGSIGITRIEWTSKNFDFHDPTDESRLAVHGSMEEGLAFDISAVGLNCAGLSEFISEVIEARK